MKIDKYFIDEHHKKLIKLFIGSAKLDEIAEETNIGISTVFNIIAGRVAINHKNVAVEHALNVALYDELQNIIPFLQRKVLDLDKTDEVQAYLDKKFTSKK